MVVMKNSTELVANSVGWLTTSLAFSTRTPDPRCVQHEAEL